MKKNPIKKEKLADTLSKRKHTHGEFTEYSSISQRLKLTALGGSKNYEMTEVQNEALDMILGKIARIVTGDPNHADNWHDIAGYAKLAEDRIK